MPSSTFKKTRRPAPLRVLFDVVSRLLHHRVHTCVYFDVGFEQNNHEHCKYTEDKRPKSGINDGFVVKIGYLSISVTAMAPGRHIIGQRRPPPDAGHICAG